MIDYQFYLNRYGWPNDLFENTEKEDFDYIVVIPSFKEPNLSKSLFALQNTSSVEAKIGILVIVNESERAENEVKEINHSTINELHEIKSRNPKIPVYFRKLVLQEKKAGVGLARKIGMDQAIRWFHKAEKTGWIICFDGDSICDQSFFVELEKLFKSGHYDCILNQYEHPLDEDNGIIEYELHLRYYADSLRYAGYPHCFQTLGSCISVSSDAYVKFGGMNTKKAGEDFYFLHNIIPYINTTEQVNSKIIPAARISDRVPFGTGKALGDFSKEENYTSYDPKIFEILSDVICTLKSGSYTFNNDVVNDFFSDDKVKLRFKRLLQQKNIEYYNKKLFEILDGFIILKLVHFLRERLYPSLPIQECLEILNSQLWKVPGFQKMSKKEKLLAIRKWDSENSVTTLNRKGQKSL